MCTSAPHRTGLGRWPRAPPHGYGTIFRSSGSLYNPVHCKLWSFAWPLHVFFRVERTSAVRPQVGMLLSVWCSPVRHTSGTEAPSVPRAQAREFCTTSPSLREWRSIPMSCTRALYRTGMFLSPRGGDWCSGRLSPPSGGTPARHIWTVVGLNERRHALCHVVRTTA